MSSTSGFSDRGGTAPTVEAMVGELFVEAAQVVLSARVPPPRGFERSDERPRKSWFNLDVDEVEGASLALERWRRDATTPLVIEIYGPAPGSPRRAAPSPPPAPAPASPPRSPGRVPTAAVPVPRTPHDRAARDATGRSTGSVGSAQASGASGASPRDSALQGAFAAAPSPMPQDGSLGPLPSPTPLDGSLGPLASPTSSLPSSSLPSSLPSASFPPLYPSGSAPTQTSGRAFADGAGDEGAQAGALGSDAGPASRPSPAADAVPASRFSTASSSFPCSLPTSSSSTLTPTPSRSLLPTTIGHPGPGLSTPTPIGPPGPGLSAPPSQRRRGVLLETWRFHCVTCLPAPGESTAGGGDPSCGSTWDACEAPGAGGAASPSGSGSGSGSSPAAVYTRLSALLRALERRTRLQPAHRLAARARARGAPSPLGYRLRTSLSARARAEAAAHVRVDVPPVEIPLGRVVVEITYAEIDASDVLGRAPEDRCPRETAPPKAQARAAGGGGGRGGDASAAEEPAERRTRGPSGQGPPALASSASPSLGSSRASSPARAAEPGARAFSRAPGRAIALSPSSATAEEEAEVLAPFPSLAPAPASAPTSTPAPAPPPRPLSALATALASAQRPFSPDEETSPAAARGSERAPRALGPPGGSEPGRGEARAARFPSAGIDAVAEAAERDRRARDAAPGVARRRPLRVDSEDAQWTALERDGDGDGDDDAEASAAPLSRPLGRPHEPGARSLPVPASASAASSLPHPSRGRSALASRLHPHASSSSSPRPIGPLPPRPLSSGPSPSPSPSGSLGALAGALRWGRAAAASVAASVVSNVSGGAPTADADRDEEAGAEADGGRDEEAGAKADRGRDGAAGAGPGDALFRGPSGGGARAHPPMPSSSLDRGEVRIRGYGSRRDVGVGFYGADAAGRAEYVDPSLVDAIGREDYIDLSAPSATASASASAVSRPVPLPAPRAGAAPDVSGSLSHAPSLPFAMLASSARSSDRGGSLPRRGAAASGAVRGSPADGGREDGPRPGGGPFGPPPERDGRVGPFAPDVLQPRGLSRQTSSAPVPLPADLASSAPGSAGSPGGRVFPASFGTPRSVGSRLSSDGPVASPFASSALARPPDRPPPGRDGGAGIGAGAGPTPSPGGAAAADEGLRPSPGDAAALPLVALHASRSSTPRSSLQGDGSSPLSSLGHPPPPPLPPHLGGGRLAPHQPPPPPHHGGRPAPSSLPSPSPPSTSRLPRDPAGRPIPRATPSRGAASGGGAAGSLPLSAASPGGSGLARLPSRLLSTSLSGILGGRRASWSTRAGGSAGGSAGSGGGPLPPSPALDAAEIYGGAAALWGPRAGDSLAGSLDGPKSASRGPGAAGDARDAAAAAAAGLPTPPERADESVARAMERIRARLGAGPGDRSPAAASPSGSASPGRPRDGAGGRGAPRDPFARGRAPRGDRGASAAPSPFADAASPSRLSAGLVESAAFGASSTSSSHALAGPAPGAAGVGAGGGASSGAPSAAPSTRAGGAASQHHDDFPPFLPFAFEGDASTPPETPDKAVRRGSGAESLPPAAAAVRRGSGAESAPRETPRAGGARPRSASRTAPGCPTPPVAPPPLAPFSDVSASALSSSLLPSRHSLEVSVGCLVDLLDEAGGRDLPREARDGVGPACTLADAVQAIRETRRSLVAQRRAGAW